MARSSWKITPLYNEKKNNQNEKNFDFIIFQRNLKISSKFIQKHVKVYNGIRFFELTVTDKMLNHTFGEFAPTRRIPLHKKKATSTKKK